jgi:hypothetical protein
MVNVYVGKAASLLSEMTGRRVNLCVPEAELISLLDMKSADKPFLAFFSGALRLQKQINRETSIDKCWLFCVKVRYPTKI